MNPIDGIGIYILEGGSISAEKNNKGIYLEIGSEIGWKWKMVGSSDRSYKMYRSTGMEKVDVS